MAGPDGTTPKKRVGLLVVASTAALGLGFWSFLATPTVGPYSFQFWLVVLPSGFALFPGFLWVWPMWRIVPQNEAAVLYPAVIGWVIYLGLGRAAVKAASPRTWNSLFALFVVLLCANVAGCWNSNRL